MFLPILEPANYAKIMPVRLRHADRREARALTRIAPFACTAVGEGLIAHAASLRTLAPPALEERGEEMHAFVSRLAKRIERRCMLAELVLTAFLKRQVCIGRQVGEVARGDVEPLGVLGANRESFVLFDGAAQRGLVHALLAKGAVERDRIFVGERQAASALAT